MARPMPERAKRRRIFLRALAAGSGVVQACELARVAFSTVYLWREKDPAFRAAWESALRCGREAMEARFDNELMRRAVDGVDDPVFYRGEVVGARKRYSDPLLMFGLHELRAGRPPAPLVTRTPRVTVIVDPQLGGDDD